MEILRMTTLREGRRETMAGPSPQMKPPVAALSERRPADGNAAVRRSTSSGAGSTVMSMPALDESGEDGGLTPASAVGREPAGETLACTPPFPDLLFAYHLLAWSEAIEDGDRRTFEEWGA